MLGLAVECAGSVTRTGVKMQRPRRSRETGRGRYAGGLGFCALALFDDDDLPAVVHAAIRANVVRSFGLAAMLAWHELHWLQVMMPAAIPLPVPADSLLRKRSQFLPPSSWWERVAPGKLHVRFAVARFFVQKLGEGSEAIVCFATSPELL